MIICSTTWWAIPGRVFWSRSSSTAPASRRGAQSGPIPSRVHRLLRFPVNTVRDGLSELQQTAERQRSHVRLPPAVRFLLHVLLKLDPAGRLLPLHLLVLVHSELIQLHKHLWGGVTDKFFEQVTNQTWKPACMNTKCWWNPTTGKKNWLLWSNWSHPQLIPEHATPAKLLQWVDTNSFCSAGSKTVYHGTEVTLQQVLLHQAC